MNSRNIVSTGDLPDCGKYYVEEDEDEEDGGKGAVLRRLVFDQNQHVIQSEVRLNQRQAECKILFRLIELIDALSSSLWHIFIFHVHHRFVSSHQRRHHQEEEEVRVKRKEERVVRRRSNLPLLQRRRRMVAKKVERRA